MNAAWLLIPILCIRFIFLRLLSADAFKRAAHFAPLTGKFKAAYYTYQIATLMIFVCPFFLFVSVDNTLLVAGLFFYVLGIIAMLIAVVNFSRPDMNGMNTIGFYRISRNPMYVSYFIYFFGVAILTNSFLMMASLIIFQISAHWIIRAEEDWCLLKFGEQYEKYKEKVNRYL